MAIILFLIFLLPLSFFLFLLSKHGSNGNLPPTPPALPLVGHLHKLLLNNSPLHIFLWKLSQNYGPLLYLQLGFKPTVVVSSAEMAKAVMKTNDLDFCRRPTQRGTSRLSYNALDVAFSPYNDYWREVRKLCAVHLFSRVKQYLREDEVGRLIEKICQLSADAKPVNLSEAMMSLSSSIICREGFGRRYGEGGVERSRFHGLLNESQALLAIFGFSDYFPLMGWLDRLTGFLGRLEKTFGQLDVFYQELIDEHLDQNRLQPEQQDIIDVLLQIREDGEFPFKITMDHIKAILMNLFIAGTDTKAAIIIWVMTFLIKNPKCMKKIQSELRISVQKKHFLDEDDIEGFIYFKSVIKETLRLQPVTPLLLPRETLRECDIGGYRVPAKSLVFVNVWAIGRDPEAWENPEEFCPERFIGSPVDYKGLHFELIPFGSGRRVCPGIQMGMATVELALANLLYRFDWEMPVGLSRDELDFDVLPGLTTHKKHDLVLLAKKIDV